LTRSSISPQEAAKRNQLAQKHQTAQEIVAEETAIGHLRFGINTLIIEEKRHLTRLEALRGRGGT
jgi:hypothetical protein